ncbi:MAG: histidine kinase, partial [Bacteroidota bacterium]
WDALNKQREVENLKATVQESELQFLKSQINPHFLFNNLNNLYSYAIENSPKTPDIILQLSSILRYMLYECKAEFVPLTKEIEQLENFTQLNELQIEDRGTIQFHNQDIQTNYQIAPLILIVFIENAFKHSQASQSEDIFIDIDVRLSPKGMLHFSCKNNYQPVTNTENLAHGIGLENVKKRLELLYPNKYNLKINKTKSMYKVDLSIQLQSTSKYELHNN